MWLQQQQEQEIALPFVTSAVAGGEKKVVWTACPDVLRLDVEATGFGCESSSRSLKNSTLRLRFWSACDE